MPLDQIQGRDARVLPVHVHVVVHYSIEKNNKPSYYYLKKKCFYCSTCDPWPTRSRIGFVKRIGQRVLHERVCRE